MFKIGDKVKIDIDKLKENNYNGIGKENYKRDFPNNEGVVSFTLNNTVGVEGLSSSWNFNKSYLTLIEENKTNHDNDAQHTKNNKIYEIEEKYDCGNQYSYRFYSLYNGAKGLYYHQNKDYAIKEGEKHQAIIEQIHGKIDFDQNT